MFSHRLQYAVESEPWQHVDIGVEEDGKVQLVYDTGDMVKGQSGEDLSVVSGCICSIWRHWPMMFACEIMIALGSPVVPLLKQTSP